MQGTMNQMVHQLPQGHYMGMNPPPPVGGFPNGMPNMQGPSNASGGQMYPHGGTFNRAQSGQMPMLPGYNPYQVRQNCLLLCTTQPNYFPQLTWHSHIVVSSIHLCGMNIMCHVVL